MCNNKCSVVLAQTLKDIFFYFTYCACYRLCAEIRELRGGLYCRCITL